MKIKKIIILAIIIIIFILLTICIFNNKTSNDDVNKNDNAEGINNEVDINFREIDMTNTDNAKIIDNIKYNISEKISQLHEYKQIKIENMKISADNSNSYLEFTVTNLCVKDDFKLYPIFISFLDKKGNVYLTIQYNLPSLKIGESKEEKIESRFDTANAYDYNITGFIDEHEIK